MRLAKRPPVFQPRSKETSRKTDLRAKTGERVGGCFVGGVDGSRGGNSGDGRGRDLHVSESVGDVVDAVVRDGGRVRLERVHVASRGREGDVRRVVTLPS
jgi:hypothetical protein